MKGLIQLVKAYLADRAYRRRFTLEMQLEHLLRTVQEDNRWMHHDATARELTARYLALLSPDWPKAPGEDVSNLRERLGLNPYSRPKADA